MSECQHRSLTGYPSTGDWVCADCCEEQPYPGGCSHLRIDNDTWKCVECGEKMLIPIEEVETVLSAPNAAPCRDPEHLAAIAAGDDFQCDHPYVPDLSRQRVVPIAIHVTYECGRCHHNGNYFSKHETVWDCGHSHHGQTIPIRGEAASVGVGE